MSEKEKGKNLGGTGPRITRRNLLGGMASAPVVATLDPKGPSEAVLKEVLQKSGSLDLIGRVGQFLLRNLSSEQGDEAYHERGLTLSELVRVFDTEYAGGEERTVEDIFSDLVYDSVGIEHISFPKLEELCQNLGGERIAEVFGNKSLRNLIDSLRPAWSEEEFVPSAEDGGRFLDFLKNTFGLDTDATFSDLGTVVKTRKMEAVKKAFDNYVSGDIPLNIDELDSLRRLVPDEAELDDFRRRFDEKIKDIYEARKKEFTSKQSELTEKRLREEKEGRKFFVCTVKPVGELGNSFEISFAYSDKQTLKEVPIHVVNIHKLRQSLWPDSLLDPRDVRITHADDSVVLTVFEEKFKKYLRENRTIRIPRTLGQIKTGEGSQ